MLTAHQIDALRSKSEQLVDPIIDYLIEDIAQRVAKAGQLTGTASYQVQQLQKLGVSQRELKKEIAKRLKISQKDAEKLLTQAAETGYDFDISRFPSRRGVPLSANSSLQQVLDTTVKLANDDLENITQTIGFVGPDGVCRELTDAYNQACDFAFQKVSTGAQDPTSAIRDAVRNFAEKGVRTIDYESGVHTSLEAAVRRNMMGALGLMQEQISQNIHDDLGCDGWEISAHGGSAPDHEPIQGRQFSDKEYQRINNSLVRRIGTLNCGHSAMPIILGVNEPQYTKEELENFRRQNEEGVTYDGKHYTLYEATQRQRKFERTIRKQKRRILVDEATGDEDKLVVDQVKLQRLKQEYTRFCKGTGLPAQHARMEAAGFTWKDGKAAESVAKEGARQIDSMARLPKKPLEKSQKTDIIDAGNINYIDLEEGRSVQKEISNVLKTNVGKIKLDGIPVQAQRYVLAATRKVLNKFPQLKGYTKGISYDPGITAIARSQSLRGNILLSSDFLDLEKLQKRHNYNIKLKAHPKGTEDIASIVVHEYGHQLDGWLTKTGVYGGSISKHGIVRTSEAVQQEVLRRVGLTDARRQEIRAEWAARGYTGKDLDDAVKWECDGFITDNLSDYATINHKEFFAECFSEYMMNPEPREIARVFGELLEEIMEGIS